MTTRTETYRKHAELTPRITREEVMAESRYWHYTTADRLLGILGDGHIRRASAGVPHGERRAVWFTTRETWAPTATAIGLTLDGTYRTATLSEMQESVGALVRLGVSVSTARYSWDHHRRCGQIDPRMADALECSAAEQGSDPADWR